MHKDFNYEKTKSTKFSEQFQKVTGKS